MISTDLGCGGVLARQSHSKSAVRWRGCQSKLIEIARRRHGRQEFVAGDATKLSKFENS